MRAPATHQSTTAAFVSAAVFTACLLAASVAAIYSSASAAHASVSDAGVCAPPSVSTSNSLDNAGQPNPDYFLPSTGTMRVLVLFADFPDAPGQGAPDALYNDPNAAQPVFDGASQWFKQVSQGQLNVQFTPVDRWIRIGQASTDFDPSGFLMNYDEQRSLVQNAINAAGVGFGGYQQVVVVASPTSAIRNSQAFIQGTGSAIAAPDGTQFAHVIDIGGTGSSDNTDLIPAVLEHELLHGLGPADLGSLALQWTIDNGNGGMAFHPIEGLTAWERLQLSWLGLDHVACFTSNGSTDIKLMPLEQSSGTRAIIVPVGGGRWVVAENRESTNEDQLICQPGTLLTNVTPYQDSNSVGLSSAISGIADPKQPATSQQCQMAWTMNGAKTYSDPSGFQLRLLCHQKDLSYIVRVADGVPMSNAASPLCTGAPPGEQAVSGSGNGGHADKAKFTAKVLSGRCPVSPKLRIKGSVTNAVPGYAYRMQEKLPGSSMWLTINKSLGLSFTGGFQVTLTLPKVTCKTKTVRLRITSGGTPISNTVTVRVASTAHH